MNNNTRMVFLYNLVWVGIFGLAIWLMMPGQGLPQDNNQCAHLQPTNLNNECHCCEKVILEQNQ